MNEKNQTSSLVFYFSRYQQGSRRSMHLMPCASHHEGRD